jgi:hypothetical protein
MKNLDEIKSEKYISVETFKKDGTSVKTPECYTIKDK